MKKLICILAVLFMAACSGGPSESKNYTRLSKNTLTHKAYYWIGLDETRDRKLIKEIMGVDPVQTEWCAAFVNMVLLENGLPRSSSVSNYPLTARSFLRWGEEAKEPKQGDILVFKRGNSNWQGHVAFYVDTKIVNNEIYYSVLGGNQDNKVSVDLYPASKLLSIRRLSLS